MTNFSVRHKWHDFPFLEYEYAWCRMDQESVGVMLCVFFKFQMYVDRLVLFAYFLLLKDDLWPLKSFLNPPLSHSYVGFSREVRRVNVTFVDQGSCSTVPLKGVDRLGLAVAVFGGLV